MEWYRRNGEKGLEDAEPTIAYIHRVNKVADAMNSKTPCAALRKDSINFKVRYCILLTQQVSSHYENTSKTKLRNASFLHNAVHSTSKGNNLTCNLKKAVKKFHRR
jgi:hypothetical protein